jgi:hypothetical protein
MNIWTPTLTVTRDNFFCHGLSFCSRIYSLCIYTFPTVYAKKERWVYMHKENKPKEEIKRIHACMSQEVRYINTNRPYRTNIFLSHASIHACTKECMIRCPVNLLLDASNKSSELWPMQVSLHWQLEYYIYLLYLARFFCSSLHRQESQEYLAVHAWCLDDVLPVRSVLYNILIHLVTLLQNGFVATSLFLGATLYEAAPTNAAQTSRPYKSICRELLVLSAVPTNGSIYRGGSISRRICRSANRYRIVKIKH